jgi:hypothetical protein
MQTKLNNTPTLTARRNVNDPRWIGSRLKESRLQSSGQETQNQIDSSTHIRTETERRNMVIFWVL